MKNPFARMFRARDKPQDAVSSAPTFYFGTSASGKAVNPSSAIQVSAVYACVRITAETIASLPFHVYESTDEGSRKATEHPLYRLIHDEPNKEMTSFILRETLLAHLLLYGNAYCQIIRTGRDRIGSIYVPDYIFNHRHKYDTLYISYDEPIRQDAGDHGLKLYDGFRHAVSGPLIIDFVNAAEEYSEYDVSDIRRELKRKSDWFDEKYGKEHLHE